MSVDTHGWNKYGTPKIRPKLELAERMELNMKQEPVIFDAEQRKIADEAIRELCSDRGYDLKALNVRTNHAHSVVSAQLEPERIADAMKARATKKLRERGLFPPEKKIWSRGRSRRRLWKPKHVDAAIRYTLYCQDKRSFDEWMAANGYGPGKMQKRARSKRARSQRERDD
ncbi:MAG TPA: transposase [Pyrinomonadaceae bacterium]|nr:transposase [Pyrinomonadaceae bacterium]